MTTTIWQMLAEAVGSLPEPFTRQQVIVWFSRHHPDANPASIGTHLQGATSNVSQASRGAFGRRTPLVTRIDHGTYVRYSGIAVPEPMDEASPASSGVQRAAEVVMLATLSDKLGITLAPTRLSHPSAARVEIDGAAPDLSVLVECWAHQGPAKVAQKYKLVNDATKLAWVAGWLLPRPQRLQLCVTDEQAVKHLRGVSWQGQAIAALGVEIVVVDLPTDVISSILDAQQLQFR